MLADIQLVALSIIAVALGLIVLGTATLLANRRPGVSLSEVYWKGSSIFRQVNLERLVSSPAAEWGRLFAAVGAFLFVVAVLMVVIGAAL